MIPGAPKGNIKAIVYDPECPPGIWEFDDSGELIMDAQNWQTIQHAILRAGPLARTKGVNFRREEGIFARKSHSMTAKKRLM